ncbi:MAG: hypothetical protein ACLQVD_07070 [Capsulimonadaceae bacterium]
MNCSKCGTELQSQWFVCPKCGKHVSDPVAKSSITALGLFAALLFVIGASAVVYFMFFFDTSIAVPGSDALGIPSGRVNNIGLMSDKQNGIIFGF